VFRWFVAGIAYGRADGAARAPRQKDALMSDKSPRSSTSKKTGKSLKEKRADKKAKADKKSEVESTVEAKR
jgi:hypothetical protein